jgi:HK97 family phage portal protein
MNLFGLNVNISRAPATATPRSADGGESLSPAALEWLRGEDTSSGGATLSNAYQQVVWVYRAINALAEQVANIPFRFSVGQAGDDQLITSGPLLNFYNHPHPHINRFQYWELRVIWLMLRGECIRIPLFSDPTPTPNLNPHSTLRSVLLLDPADFQHIVEDHQLIGWRYTGFGARTPLASQVFLPEEVWFEKLPNPFDFWRGMSPLSVAAMATRTDFAAGAFMRGLIENNADTGLIVRAEKPMSPEQRAQVIATLNERKRRAGAADRPLLLSGVAEILKPELSSSDLQFLENRKFSRAEICAVFGVPEEILTTTDHAKYDVMAGARLNFIENRVAPLCRRLEAEEESTVKAIDPQACGWFDLDSLPILHEARRNRLATARAGFEMGVPFNELNRVLELGFKPLPWGEKGYVATGLREVEEGKKSEIRDPKSEGNPKPEFRNPKAPRNSINPINLLNQLTHP